MTAPGVVDQLSSHRMLAGVPRQELEWLAAHGVMERHEAGAMVARKGEEVDLVIILSGHVAHLSDQSGTWRKVIDWRAGDITGQLPYSRMVTSPGNSVVEETTEVLSIPRKYVDELPVACPKTTAAMVHAMVDRARTFKSSDLQVEKMASLGKLAAGLAHELNNPASAAARSAQLLMDALAESDSAARAVGAAQLSERELEQVERVRVAALATPVTSVLSPMERADREEELADWLEEHDVDSAFASSLVETAATVEGLNQLASVVSGEKLNATLRWLAAGCTVRSLARDIERAASRVHKLVSAVKGFTYMDHAAAPEVVDIAKGLTDTLAVLGGKARGKSVSLVVDAPVGLPCVRAPGGELNQVWANLVDNALDAVPDGGRVSVIARAQGNEVVVTVTDNGPGIPADMQRRIFDPFFTTKPVGKGTGLGLDIVRRLVDQNGGRIDVESAPGRTVFTVTLTKTS